MIKHPGHSTSSWRSQDQREPNDAAFSGPSCHRDRAKAGTRCLGDSKIPGLTGQIGQLRPKAHGRNCSKPNPTLKTTPRKGPGPCRGPRTKHWKRFSRIGSPLVLWHERHLRVITNGTCGVIQKALVTLRTGSHAAPCGSLGATLIADWEAE